MKKVLWILGTGIVWILYCFIVGIVFMVGNIIKSVITRSEIQSLNQDIFNIAMLLGLIIVAILSMWLWRRWNARCHACKRWGAVRIFKTELLKQEDISVRMELEHRNFSGQVTGTHDQYIPGKRKIYRDTYQCKYCGKMETRVRTEKKASI